VCLNSKISGTAVVYLMRSCVNWVFLARVGHECQKKPN
jgi:hypothetical protein